MVLFYFGGQLLGFSASDFVEVLPETVAVIFMQGMRQFMHDDVIRQMLRQPYQMNVQVNVVGSRATAPSRSEVFDANTTVGKAVHRG